jgi:hypothetical protein
MSVTHHPPSELLASFAAGTLDAGEHLVVAVHVSGCSVCRRFVRAVERIGGSTLEAVEPVPMKAGAFEAVMAKLDSPSPQPDAPTVIAPDDDLPEILRHYRIGRRRRVAPGVSMRPIELPGPSRSRAFLLQRGWPVWPGRFRLRRRDAGSPADRRQRRALSLSGGHDRRSPHERLLRSADRSFRTPLICTRGPLWQIVRLPRPGDPPARRHRSHPRPTKLGCIR